MMLRISAIYLVVAISLCACSTMQPVRPDVKVIDSPSLSITSKAELGDTIVEKGVLTTYDGLHLKDNLSWGDGFFAPKITIPSGRLRARQIDKRFIYYVSSEATSSNIYGPQPVFGGLCKKLNDPTFIGVFGGVSPCAKYKTEVNATAIRITDVDATNFRQELIYNGKSGDTVKFLYREFSGDYARPPFSQDIQYDLKESYTVGFKGVRIEIIDANNTQITYKVLSSFPAVGGN